MNEDEKNIQNNQDFTSSEDSIVNSIANSEARGDEAPVQGATQGKADFTSMFGVQSEETQEEKEMSKYNPDIPIVLEVKEEDREQVVVLSDDEKKANHKKNFNSDERLIYQIEPDKQGNPLMVVLFFALLIVFMFMLPKIGKQIDLSSFFKMGGPAGKNGEEGEKEPEFFKIESAASRAKIGQLEMINFSKNEENGEYTFSLTIQNVGDRIYLFDKKYYIVLYSDNNPIYYALIHSYNGIPSKSAQDVKLIISQRAYEKANRFKVEEIDETKYREVNISETDGEYKVLTCRYRNDEMKYYFIDNQLIKIRETYTEENNEQNPTYEADKEKYKALTEKYKKIEKFDSIFISDAKGFSQINEFNLHDILDNDIIALKTYRFFSYRANKNTVAFEIESQGYTCS